MVVMNAQLTHFLGNTIGGKAVFRARVKNEEEESDRVLCGVV